MCSWLISRASASAAALARLTKPGSMTSVKSSFCTRTQECPAQVSSMVMVSSRFVGRRRFSAAGDVVGRDAGRLWDEGPLRRAGGRCRDRGGSGGSGERERRRRGDGGAEDFSTGEHGGFR